METIQEEYKKLCQEIRWRFTTSDYTEEDKYQVVIHETIDKEVSFISIAQVGKLCDELGINKILEIEQDYINEFGEIPKEKKGFDKLRLLLYVYFENKVLNDETMRKFLKMD